MTIVVRTPATLAVILLALGGSTAANAQPLLVRKFVDLTLPQPGLSALCGFTVYRRIEGFVDAALFFDDEGNPVREIDTSPSLRNTFFAPETNKSVSYPGTGTAVTEYYPDLSAVVTLDGFLTFVHVPGSGPLLISVGRIVFTADVVGTNADGLPVTGSPTAILFESGIDDGSALGACQALAL
jgi:hypothetical protein